MKRGLWLLVVPCLAFAAPPESGGRTSPGWDRLGEASLLEEFGDFAAAAAIYEELVLALPPDDPERAEALYRAGRLYQHLGRTGDAISAFDACVRVRAWRERCLAERGELEIERSQARALPTRWTFDDTQHGLIHPAIYDNGTIRIQIPADEPDRVLVWHTRLERGEIDQLVVGVALDAPAGATPVPDPVHVAFEARSVGAESWLRLRAVDLDGRRYTSPAPLQVGPTATAFIVPFAVMAGDPGAPPLDPREIHRLILEDQTMLAPGEPLERDVVIDDFRIE